MTTSGAAGSWCYLRVEGVNLGHFVYDTEDLSTIRGGGLMLLRAVEQVEKHMRGRTDVRDLERVTSGASQAVFRFHADGLEAVRQGVEDFLRDDRQLRHATFVVDTATGGDDDYPRLREELLARNRWRQMRQLSLAVPERNGDSPGGRPYCSIDFARPATCDHFSRNDRKERVSASVSARAKFGLEQKQAFYQEEIRRVDRAFEVPKGKKPAAWHFRQVAERGRSRVGDDGSNPDPLGNLDGKIAVLYADGNKFGAIQRASCADVEAQRRWDVYLQRMRQKALKALWDRTQTNDLAGCRWRFESGEAEGVRLETLLWGGDELIWVVPAWKGWETLRLLFDEARKVQDEEGGWPVPDRGQVKLTHGAGLVFCHAEAPIHRVVDLAHELAEQAKGLNEKVGDDYGKFADVVAYQVLESFDQLGDEVARVRAGHLPRGCDPSRLVLQAGDLEPLEEDVRWMSAHFPRGSLYRIVRLLQAGSSEDLESAKRWRERALRDLRASDQEKDEFRARFAIDADDPRAAARWFHAIELWDYLVEDAQA